MSIKLILLVCALVCEVLAAFGVPRVGWMCLGFAFVIAAFIV